MTESKNMIVCSISYTHNDALPASRVNRILVLLREIFARIILAFKIKYDVCSIYR